MSKFLADILATDHPLFTKTISAFEKASGDSGTDTRLIADITEKAHSVMRSLGMDTGDTSAEELYHVLNSTVKSDKAAQLLSDCNYVLLRFDDGPVSFNLHDVIENAHHELPFTDRQTGHAQRYLRAEIVKRYAEHDRTDNTMVHNMAIDAGLKRESDTHFVDIDHLLSAGSEVTHEPAHNEAPHILAIGDIFTDAFIKLNEEVARVETDESGEKRISLPFGSKPPYDGADIVRAVGPSPNAAVAFARLGLSSSLLAWMGDDQTASDAIDYLKKENINTDLTQIQAGMASNYYYVLRLGAERTILVKNEAYAYNWVQPSTPPDWVYLSLISNDSWQLHEDLLLYLDEHEDTKLAFQPGTFHFTWGVDKLSQIYKRSYIVVMNREEAADVTGKPTDSIRGLTSALHEFGPGVVVITDGSNGSYASYDGKLVTIPNYPDPGPPVDRTGAGDAFASTIVAGLASGKSMDEALTWAPINSMSVVQQLGAQAGLLTKEQIADFLRKAPEEYRVNNYDG